MVTMVVSNNADGLKAARNTEALPQMFYSDGPYEDLGFSQ